MSAPTNVRVETYSAGASMVRWTYSGANPVKVYRSDNDEVSYANISGAGVAVGTLEFLDTTQGDGARYFYKLSDDSGSTFSAAVFVVSVTDCVGISNTPGLIERAIDDVTPEMFNQVVEHLQRQDDQDSLNPPCIICSKDGAVVINCLDNCNHFQISVTEDINSISTIGCFGCPDIDFLVADGESFGICGFPLDCGFSGDECKHPIIGPRKYTTPPGIITTIPPTTSAGPCPCVLPVTIVPVIQCCSDPPCDFNCDESKTLSLKACGGYGKPYTWSIITGSSHVQLVPNRTNTAMCAVKYTAAMPVDQTSYCDHAFLGVVTRGDHSLTAYAAGKSTLCGGYTDPLMHACSNPGSGSVQCFACLHIATSPICSGTSIAPACDFTDPNNIVTALNFSVNGVEYGPFNGWGTGDPVPGFPSDFASAVSPSLDCTCINPGMKACGSSGCPDIGGILIQVVDALGTIATVAIDVNP